MTPTCHVVYRERTQENQRHRDHSGGLSKTGRTPGVGLVWGSSTDVHTIQIFVGCIDVPRDRKGTEPSGLKVSRTKGAD